MSVSRPRRAAVTPTVAAGATQKGASAHLSICGYSRFSLTQRRPSPKTRFPCFPSRVSLTPVSAALSPPSMLSFVVPAHNEQACLGRTVRAIHAAARATGRAYEVIVVDDASTDATAEVA